MGHSSESNSSCSEPVGLSVIAIVSELIIIMKEKKEKMEEEEEEGWGVAQQTVFVIVSSRPYS